MSDVHPLIQHVVEAREVAGSATHKQKLHRKCIVL